MKTIIEKHGSAESVHEFYQNIGRKGGIVISEAKQRSGFGRSREWAAYCGAREERFRGVVQQRKVKND